MKDKILVPPIKCQGKKTKLVSWIKEYVEVADDKRWIEPFMGSGVVGFNVESKRAIFSDHNKHIMLFYRLIGEGKNMSGAVRLVLERDGKLLRESEGEYYYEVRKRFNERGGGPFEFIFLNRSCFNGVMRFNKKGEFNVPFCRLPNRFSPAYITRICNQIASVEELTKDKDWEFACKDFVEVISMAEEGDLIYCDPPYLGRNANYFDVWNEEKEKTLFDLLDGTKARFILSTWGGNENRQNEFIEKYWKKFNIVKRKHYYYVGPKVENRYPMVEALIMNF